MGSSKKESTEQTAVTTPSFIPGFEEQEKASIQRMFGLEEAAYPGMQGLAQNMPNLINTLLTGGQLPGFFGGLEQGISPEMTTQMAQEGIRDIPPALQMQGLLDSGVGQSIMGRTAGDIRRQVAEFNLQNRMGLLNAALGGFGPAMSSGLGQTSLLSQRLAGLRPITQQQWGMGKSSTGPDWGQWAKLGLGMALAPATGGASMAGVGASSLAGL